MLLPSSKVQFRMVFPLHLANHPSLSLTPVYAEVRMTSSLLRHLVMLLVTSPTARLSKGLTCLQKRNRPVQPRRVQPGTPYIINPCSPQQSFLRHSHLYAQQAMLTSNQRYQRGSGSLSAGFSHRQLMTKGMNPLDSKPWKRPQQTDHLHRKRIIEQATTLRYIPLLLASFKVSTGK